MSTRPLYKLKLEAGTSWRLYGSLQSTSTSIRLYPIIAIEGWRKITNRSQERLGIDTKLKYGNERYVTVT